MKMILCASMMVLLLTKPGIGESAAINALRTWGMDVVPSLFPYMVLCQSLSSLPSRSAVTRFLSFFMGLLGGSPSASAALKSLAEHRPLSRKMLLFLSACSGTISPMFFLGPAAIWFASKGTGLRLLAAQYIGAILAGAFAAMLCRNTSVSEDIHQPNLSKEAPSPIARSISAILNVGGCIVFYSTVASQLSALLPFESPATQILHALLEISGGLHSLSGIHLSGNTREVLASGLCGFGSFSILSQNLLFLRPLGLRMMDLVRLSVLRGVFSAAVMFLMLIR